MLFSALQELTVKYIYIYMLRKKTPTTENEVLVMRVS